jgi:hypothetical protein
MLSVIYAKCHLCRVSFVLNVIMLSVIYAECHSDEGHFADCCDAIEKLLLRLMSKIGQ